ncbi:ABC-type transport auxiliary lipoprotein family protein [Sphingomonas sp.]|jgi:cholesterol transport system auxiliary component|uniref:ABC-type transport auxiliary lipoprotein family protein n=1 Tax=Sphingomonas sp. TaxID=28214 RepID=UPI002D7F2362|nr:ABC-type transport auxiliary lipoprotein family protein [Sphingomonas sp.]HEU0043991.1 ABC-type transport auxiliary lipoprotein family protein [Sphingomonas sp.]
MTRTLPRAALALTFLPLAGCISFGAKPPASLLTLTAATPIAVGPVQSSAQARAILLQLPTTPASLATQRVPVQATATTLAYVPDALWAEPPARLFARLLADTLTAGGAVVISGVQPVDSPAGKLSGELRAFGFDATERSAVVTFDATLTRSGSTALEKRRFEARVPVAAIDAATAGTAINDAANQVAAQVAQWAAQ